MKYLDNDLKSMASEIPVPGEKFSTAVIFQNYRNKELRKKFDPFYEDFRKDYLLETEKIIKNANEKFSRASIRNLFNLVAKLTNFLEENYTKSICYTFFKSVEIIENRDPLGNKFETNKLEAYNLLKEKIIQYPELKNFYRYLIKNSQYKNLELMVGQVSN